MEDLSASFVWPSVPQPCLTFHRTLYQVEGSLGACHLRVP